jgi:hypothetical protein
MWLVVSTLPVDSDFPSFVMNMWCVGGGPSSILHMRLIEWRFCDIVHKVHLPFGQLLPSCICRRSCCSYGVLVQPSLGVVYTV